MTQRIGTSVTRNRTEFKHGSIAGRAAPAPEIAGDGIAALRVNSGLQRVL